MMKIKYLGPSDSVEVGGFGPHLRGEVKDYPEEAGRELLATSKRQQFAEIRGRKAGDVTDEAPGPKMGPGEKLPEKATTGRQGRKGKGGGNAKGAK